MKIAVLGYQNNGIMLSKHGVSATDTVVYIENAPSLIQKLGTTPLSLASVPRLESDFATLLTSLGIEGVINLCSTTRHGKDLDLKAFVEALGISYLVGPTDLFRAVEYDRWATRTLASTYNMDTIPVLGAGLKVDLKDAIIYPAYIKRKDLSSSRPIYVESATASGWNRLPDDVELWAEPALSGASLVNVNYIIAHGVARLHNAIKMDFTETSRYYGKNPVSIPFDDPLITGKVLPYINDQAALYPEEKVFASIQFLLHEGVYYFLENNCHPSISVPWRGVTPLLDLIATPEGFTSDTTTLDPFVLSVKRAVDYKLPIEGFDVVMSNGDIDVISQLLTKPLEGTAYKMANNPESISSGIALYLYNGAVVPEGISNLEDKV